MNMGKEHFLVSRVSEEVARLFVQMVSFYVPVGFSLVFIFPSRNSGRNKGKQVRRAAFNFYVSTDVLICLLTVKGIDGSRTESQGAGPNYVGPNKAA